VELVWGEAADIVRESGFRKADQLVAMDTAVMLESLLDIHRNLAVEAIMPAIDRSANSARKAGVQDKLATNDGEDP
jgi:ABC-type proline/glycine betaine transport system substrate-binding protein